MNVQALIGNAGKLEKYHPRFNAALGLTDAITAKQVREKLEPFRGYLGRSVRVLNGDMLVFFRSTNALNETADCDWSLALPVGPDGTKVALKFNPIQVKRTCYLDEISWELFCIYYQGKIYSFKHKRHEWIVMVQRKQLEE